MSMGHDELTTLFGQDGNEFNLLGLSHDMIVAQLTSVDFTSSELQLIKDVFVKEMSKITKEISDSVIEFDSAITSELDICKIAQDLQKLGLNVNAEIESLVDCQNEFIELKYTNILGQQIKKAEEAEKDLIKTSQVACDLYEKTSNAVYPSEEYYDKMKQEAEMLKKQLDETNKELEELETMKEKYDQLDQQEFKIVVNQYREIMREIRMKEMALEEINNVSQLSQSTLCNDFDTIYYQEGCFHLNAEGTDSWLRVVLNNVDLVCWLSAMFYPTTLDLPVLAKHNFDHPVETNAP